ncbi:MAG TPA: hypothetical protein VKV35_05935 [Streptosporangiaceae bacterium]|jgi:hypothetical protein|nr:hypothetical protein [Streptosporangiaceae bacterium]
MDEQDRRRACLAGRVTKLAGGRDLRDALPPLHGTRTIPLIIGLPDDTLASSLRKAEKLGGHAHLIVLDELPGDRVRIHALHIEFGYKPVTERDDHPERPVPEDLELGMLIRNIEPGEEFTYNSWGSEAKMRFLASIVQPVPAQA